MDAVHPRRFLIALLGITIIAALAGCPDGARESGGGSAGPEPQAQIPLAQTPGVHLLYTVNDPRAGAIGVARLAHVLIAEPDGSRREVLFGFPGFIFHMVPSPTGDKIAFVGGVRGEAGQEEKHLFLFDIARGNYADISAPGFYSRAVRGAPLFTPDGSHVLFLSRWSNDSGEFNVFKCEASSGQMQGLYTSPVEDVPLGMMPDGSRVVAVRRVPDVIGAFEYIAIDVNTGRAEVLHRFENLTKVGPPHFDDSGTMVYCDVKVSEELIGAIGGNPSREVLAIDLTDGTERSLLEPNTVNYLYQVFRSGDGQWQMLIRRQMNIEGEDTPMSRIAVANLDGSNFRYLTDTSARCYLLPPPSNIPPLSPDDSLLYYFRQDPVFELVDIWVMNSDGSNPVNISNTAGYNEGSAGWMVVPAS